MEGESARTPKPQQEAVGRLPVVMHVSTARGWRGGERQVLWLTERLTALGVTSIVASPPDEPLARAVVERGLPFVALAARGEWDVLAVARLAGAARRLGVDVLNAHDGHANTLAAFAVGVRRLVLTRRVHHALAPNFISRWKFRRADAVIAISHAVAEVLTSCGVPGAKIHVVHSGVPLDRRIRPASRATLESLGVRPEAPLVVMVGALVGHKDPETFLRAMALVHRRLPEARALLVGSGPLEGKLRAELQAAGLEDVVLLPGHRADADALLAAASVAVLSSRAEGLGTVVLDAMQMGVPVVATATPAMGEVIRDGVDGFLAPVGDPALLADRIVHVLQGGETERGETAEVVASARERVARVFSAEATAAGTLSVYRGVLAGR